MSLSGAMNTAVSALMAQSQALAMISDNLANASTTGYKTTHSSFATLVTQQSTGSYYPSGGVVSNARQNVTQQGLISSTSTATDMAIDGNGMFVVTYGLDGRDTYFTRDGEFDTDSDGYLKLGNYYLQGWPTDKDGNVSGVNLNSSSSLTAVNVNRFSSTASATGTETIKANLPADAAVDATYNTSVDVVDSLGVTHNMSLTWTKTATNSWTVSFSDPTLATDSTSTTGTVSGGPFQLDFNTDGTLAAITDTSTGSSADPPQVTVSGWTTGASDSTLSFNLGTIGKSDGLSQLSSGASTSSTPEVDVHSIKQDGIAYGRLTGVSIGTDGTVTAKYDNGYTMPIYKIPVATFANEDGLSAMSNGVYAQTGESGAFTLHTAGTGGSGTVKGSSLESSTVDSSDEFSRMISAQQAYSAASQVISTTKNMFDTLMQSVR